MNRYLIKKARLAAFFDELEKLSYVAPTLGGPGIGTVASVTPPPRTPLVAQGKGATIKAVIDAVPNQKPAQPKADVQTPKSPAIKSSISLSSTTPPTAKSRTKAPSAPKPKMPSPGGK